MRGPRVECYLNGELAVSSQECPLNVGGVGFRVLQTVVEIDDVRVEKLTGEDPAAGIEPLTITAEQIPMGVGDTWTFRVSSDDEKLNGKTAVYSFYDSFESDGETFFRRRFEIPDVVEKTGGLQVLRPDGWYGYWDPADETPYDVLSFPLTAGMEWERDVLWPRGDEDRGLRRHEWPAEAEETVEVPAGAFRCLRVRYCYNTLDVADDTVVWLAPEVGLAKIQERELTLDLMSFEQHAPAIEAPRE